MSNNKSCFNCIYGFQDAALKASRELLCTLIPQATLDYTEAEEAEGTALQDVPDLCMFHNLEGDALKKACAKKIKARKAQSHAEVE